MKRRAALTTIAAGAALLKMKNPVFHLCADDSDETLYVTMVDLAKEIFSDQIERAVFVTVDLKVFIFHSSETDRVIGPESWICEYLGAQGAKPKDIALIIHNHFTARGFSARDNRTYHYFKERGFRGLFAIYYPVTGNVRVKADKS